MLRDEFLYELAKYDGGEPDWKEAYKQAYETCKAQQAKIAELEPMEKRVFDAIAGAAEELGPLGMEFHIERPGPALRLWVRKVHHFYEGTTIAECIEKAIVGVREEEAAKATAQAEAPTQSQEEEAVQAG